MFFFLDTSRGPEEEKTGYINPRYHHSPLQYSWSFISIYCQLKCFPFYFFCLIRFNYFFLSSARSNSSINTINLKIHGHFIHSLSSFRNTWSHHPNFNFTMQIHLTIPVSSLDNANSFSFSYCVTSYTTTVLSTFGFKQSESWLSQPQQSQIVIYKKLTKLQQFINYRSVHWCHWT